MTFSICCSWKYFQFNKHKHYLIESTAVSSSASQIIVLVVIIISKVKPKRKKYFSYVTTSFYSSAYDPNAYNTLFYPQTNNDRCKLSNFN